MELSKEFIEKNQLSEDQVGAISTQVDEYVKTQKDTIWSEEWSSKANEQAEGIISGALKKTIELTGIARNEKEKAADYLERANNLYFEGTRSTLQRKQSELEEKLKNTKGDEVLKQELEQTKEQMKELQKKEAEYDEWVKNDYKGKYEKNYQELSVFKQRIAFKDNLPSKPETVNKYEWDAKIKQFQTELLEKNNLVFDENETAWLVDKENEFKKTKLEDAVKQNTSIQELLQGRNQGGLGSETKKEINLDGVPFKIPENATPKERQKAIKDYLASQNIQPTSAEYSKKFAEYNAKILQGKKPE